MGSSLIGVFSASKRHKLTAVAFAENIAKLTPSSVGEGPSGSGLPDEGVRSSDKSNVCVGLTTAVS